MSIRDMVARHSNAAKTLDFYPTPPYATRALFEYVLPESVGTNLIWDPACGAGHMSEVFKEYGCAVRSSDIVDRGYPGTEIRNFATEPAPMAVDYVVTNPPYELMTAFYQSGMTSARKGMALLTRIQFLEGQRRFRHLFSIRPPQVVAVFSDRIPFISGKVVRSAPKMFTHCWVYWELDQKATNTELRWIPPEAQATLEKPRDYT